MAGDVLQKILENKREDVMRLEARHSLSELRLMAGEGPPPRDFLAALRNNHGAALIAEIKRSSPSAGSLAREVKVSQRAGAYQRGGAAALSVLTDEKFFGGSLQDLVEARACCGLPVLRKDFIIRPSQIYQARAAGADAVLLIAAALSKAALSELLDLARELGMTPLIEVHNQGELRPVLDLGPELVGINNRDLKTLRIDLNTCLRLRPLIPSGVTVVAESGVGSPQDIAKLRAGGLDAFLVGTSLMRADDPEEAVRALLNSNGGKP